MRTFGILLLLCGTLGADVLVLKDGRKIRGKVADKGLHFEVVTDAGLRTFVADEVEDVLTDPKELIGDAEAVFEGAKADYQRAVGLANPADQQALLRTAVEKASRARDVFAEAADLFPETDAPARKLVLVMQLLRLCRERLGSERAGPAPVAAPAAAVAEAAAVLPDRAVRTDSAKRAAAYQAFRALRAAHPEVYDPATAAVLYLARSDAEWGLDGAGLKAVDEYFEKGWLRDPLKLTPDAHLEAVRWLLDRGASARKVDPLALFALGHLGSATPGPDRDKAAVAFGLTASGGSLGTAEGFAVRDLGALVAEEKFLAAVLCGDREYKGVQAAGARFVHAYALARHAQQQKQGFDRAANALTAVSAAEPAVRDHVAALAKSVRDAAVCAGCAGEGKLRCTNCHGVKEIKVPCARCGGKGRLIPPGLVVSKPKQLRKAGSQCPPCKGTGVEKTFRCMKCKDGAVDCPKCPQPKSPPEVADLFASSGCARCEGAGLLFRRVAWPCGACLGLGQRLVPKADPSKVLQ